MAKLEYESWSYCPTKGVLLLPVMFAQSPTVGGDAVAIIGSLNVVDVKTRPDESTARFTVPPRSHFPAGLLTPLSKKATGDFANE